MFLLRTIKLNINFIYRKTLIVASTIFSLTAIFLSFITWQEIGITSIYSRLLILISIIFISTVLTIFNYTFLKKTNTVWQNGSGKIILRYGDIIKTAFSKRNKKDKIIVIPVNTSFDTIVDEDISSVDKPLVSPKSIHGQWLNNIINSNKTIKQLDIDIEEQFQKRNILPINNLPLQEKARGKIAIFKQGTIISLKGEKKSHFFLLALSEFDSNNSAYCSKENFIECIKSLIDFYNKHSQGFEIYIPIMGTSLSRVGLSHQESLNIIKSLFLLYSDTIKGTVNIVVYNKDKDKVSIWN